MSETLAYIESYFNGELSTPEKHTFENRCEADPSFAEDVAFYIQMRAGLKQKLYQQKKKEFAEQYKELASRPPVVKQPVIRKLFPYIAAAIAACLLLFVIRQFFFKPDSSQELAENYIQKNIVTLGIPMGSTKDSLDLGVAQFNQKNYQQAEVIFKALTSSSAEGAEAIKDLGIVYLVTGKYDQAVNQFETLSKNTNLYANPGLFYEAVSLMKRDQPGDKTKAKSILEEVIRQDLPGKKEAELWIQKL
jgi:tetratricopeptide (TPR) repeat protein